MKIKKVIAVIAGIAVALSAAVGGVYGYKSYQDKKLVAEVQPVSSLRGDLRQQPSVQWIRQRRRKPFRYILNMQFCLNDHVMLTSQAPATYIVCPCFPYFSVWGEMPSA